MGFPKCCILWVLTPKGSKQGPPHDTLNQASPFPPTLYAVPVQLIDFAFPRKKPTDRWLVKQSGPNSSTPTRALCMVQIQHRGCCRCPKAAHKPGNQTGNQTPPGGTPGQPSSSMAPQRRQGMSVGRGRHPEVPAGVHCPRRALGTGEGGGAGDITIPCQGSGNCPPLAAGELRAQQGQGFRLKPPTSFAASSAWKRNPLPANVAGAGTKPCPVFLVAEHHPRDSCPHPLRMWGSHPSWHCKGDTTQPGGRWEVGLETPPKCPTWLPCSQPRGGRDAALAHLGCSPHASASHWGTPGCPAWDASQGSAAGRGEASSCPAPGKRGEVTIHLHQDAPSARGGGPGGPGPMPAPRGPERDRK